MNVFEYTEYKDFIRSWVKSLPTPQRRGKFKEIASTLQCHPTQMSQVIRGIRQFSFDQAFALSQLVGLNEDETEYFITLVQIQRSETEALRVFLIKKRDRLRAKISIFTNS